LTGARGKDNAKKHPERIEPSVSFAYNARFGYSQPSR